MYRALCSKIVFKMIRFYFSLKKDYFVNEKIKKLILGPVFIEQAEGPPGFLLLFSAIKNRGGGVPIKEP